MNEKRRTYMKLWRKANRNKINQYQRDYYLNNRDKYRVRYGRAVNENDPNAKNCSTGRAYELLVFSLLDGAIDTNADNFSGKWDLVWQDQKVEVKSRIKRYNQYNFHIKNVGVPDIYAFVCRDTCDSIEKILLIPGYKVKTKSFTIKSGTCDYDEFRLDVVI